MKFTVEDIKNNKREDFLLVGIPLVQEFIRSHNYPESGYLGDMLRISYIIPEHKSAIVAVYDYLECVKYYYDESYVRSGNYHWVDLGRMDSEVLNELSKG
mgnify:CR=1 FL=1